ncbi:MAG: hypothetical protein QOE22_409 [Candidatus Parcubacteria bacterium]|jgi:hypothetical protein|nr:hypothetical protein [Candidatus Parcubacteria bacterium]
MNNKHRAVWAVGALILVFLALLIWYMWTHPAPRALAPGDVATTTPPTLVGEPLHIIDNGKHYEIDAAYPSATPLHGSAGAEADTAAVGIMRGFAQKTIDAFKEENQLTTMTDEEFAELTFGRDAMYAMDIDYKLYEGSKTVSYVYAIYQDTMGAHPNTYYRTFTFDKASGEALELADLFAPGAQYLERLSVRTRADLPKIMAKMGEITPAEVDTDYINSGTLPIADSFGNFAVDDANLVMIFPPYQVGPYVYGTIEVPIPLSSLSDILNPKYRP